MKAIQLPNPEEESKELEAAFAQMRAHTIEHRKAATEALLAMGRLAEVMRGRSGQPYKVRALLYSLWNGKPADVSDLLNLDWQIRKDICAVMLGFGFEDSSTHCFYDALQAAVTGAGQWSWFLEERFEVGKLKDYVAAAERAL